MKPFFSIGVTTYNRKCMLKECLTSILRQTFCDFEVIVGNDYPHEEISSDILNIKDSRIRFVNHPKNMGEVNNMNTLLAMSSGRYFTWLADDDMYASNFLESVYESLAKFNFKSCVFTSYAMDGEFYSREESHGYESVLLEGNEFLRSYLGFAVKVLGCYGVFKRDFIVNIGGIKHLGRGFGPYSDVMLAINVGSLKKIIYIDSPLILFRPHSQSLSLISSDADAYSSAQEELCQKSVDVFRKETIVRDFDSNLFMLLRWCLRDYCAVMYRSGSLRFKKIFDYLRFIFVYIKILRRGKYKMLVIVLRDVSKLVIKFLKRRVGLVFVKIFKCDPKTLVSKLADIRWR